jgi:4-carboxymuconolactone decarboxylase
MTRIPPAELPADLAVHNNLVQTAHHNPEMFRGFASLSGRVHSASHLSDRTRELVVLRIAAHLGAEYEWTQHEPFARQHGVTDDEVHALRSGNLDAFNGADGAALSFAMAVETTSVDDASFADAKVWFSDVELVDIAMLAGFYGLASRFVRAFDVDLEG